MDSLMRTLVNGAPRSQVLACLYYTGTGARVAVKSTDKDGKFKMDVTALPSGIYELHYFGDGIVPTIKDGSGDVISEDPITPWEYEIEIFIGRNLLGKLAWYCIQQNITEFSGTVLKAQFVNID